MRMSSRVDRLEAREGDMLLAGFSIEELEDDLAAVSSRLRLQGLAPTCGWDGPLSALVGCLERVLAH